MAKIILVVYVVLVVLGVVRMRQIGVRLLGSLAFVVNVSVVFWLLFLYVDLSSEQWWVPLCCLFLSVLLVPITIHGIALGIRSRNDAKLDVTRPVFVSSDTTRYLNAEIPLLVVWAILYQTAPFRSHLGLTLLCGLASAGVVAGILAVVNRRLARFSVSRGDQK